MSNKTAISNSLDALVGKNLWYSHKEVKISKYEIDEERERVFIHFENRGPLDRPLDTAMHLIGSFTLLPDLPAAPPEQREAIVHTVANANIPAVAMSYVGSSSTMDKATEIVLASINDMISGKMDLDTGEAVNTSVNTLLDIERTKIAKGALIAKFLGLH